MKNFIEINARLYNTDQMTDIQKSGEKSIMISFPFSIEEDYACAVEVFDSAAIRDIAFELVRIKVLDSHQI